MKRSSLRVSRKLVTDVPPEEPVVSQVGNHTVEEVLETTGLTVEEFNKAVTTFKKHVPENASSRDALDRESEEEAALSITDVDLVLRKLRLFPTRRLLRSLFLEIDENSNNSIELLEFITMVSKLRGRRQLSADFYIGSLPRTVCERFRRVFQMLDNNEDARIAKDEVLIATRQLGIGQDMDTDQMKLIIEDCPCEEKGFFTEMEFLALLARLRKPPPEIDVALLSLSNEETETYTEAFNDFRANNSHVVAAADIRHLATQLGFTAPVERIRGLMGELGIDNAHASMQIRDFLYIIVSLGAGASPKPRPLLLPGASYEEAIASGLGLDDLWELGYDDVAELRRVGVTAQRVWKAGFAGTSELRRGGYGAAELRKVGATAKQLKLAGFSLEELRTCGFSAEVLESLSMVLSKSNVDVLRSDEGWGIQLRAAQEREALASAGEPRWWATPRIKAMLDQDGLKEQRVSASRSSDRRLKR